MTSRRKIRAARRRRRREHAAGASVDTHGASVTRPAARAGANRRAAGFESVGGDGVRAERTALGHPCRSGPERGLARRNARRGERIPAPGTVYARLTRRPQTASPRGSDGFNGSGREGKRAKRRETDRSGSRTRRARSARRGAAWWCASGAGIWCAARCAGSRRTGANVRRTGRL